MGAFYTLVSEAANRYNFHSEDLKRTISIDFKDVSPIVRKLSDAEKNTLVESGRKCVSDFCLQSTSISQN